MEAACGFCDRADGNEEEPSSVGRYGSRSVILVRA